eukprot:16391826-Heterocapsa_arctica.AAC.1
MEADTQNICGYNRWETPGAWMTGMSRKQIGQLAQWLRGRNMTQLDKNNLIRNDCVFYIQEHMFSKSEKEAQNKMYDALTNGHHGYRVELSQPGYRFKMELHGHNGW